MSRIQRDIMAEIERALKNKRLSARAASIRASGTGSVIANMRRGSAPAAETLQMLAEVLDLEFYFGPPRSGEGAGDSPEKPRFFRSRDNDWAGLAGRIGAELKRIPLVGQCSAGDSIVYDEPTQVATGEGAIALRVRGESMAPAFHDGDYVLVDGQDISEASALLGKRCLVEVAAEDGGGGYLKLVVAGSRPGLYTLTSLNRAYQPVRDVRLRRARRVIGMVSGDKLE